MLLQQALKQSANGPFDTPYAMTFLPPPDPGIAVFVGIAKDIPPNAGWTDIVWASTVRTNHTWCSVVASPYLMECDEWEPLYEDHPYRQSLCEYLRHLERHVADLKDTPLHAGMGIQITPDRIRGIDVQQNLNTELDPNETPEEMLAVIAGEGIRVVPGEANDITRVRLANVIDRAPEPHFINWEHDDGV